MSLVTWILIGVIILVAIGLGVGVFFTGLFRGAEIVGQNPTVQNATQEAKNFVDDKIESGAANALIVVTTDRSEYNKGDPVIVTVKNTGSETLTFPDSALGLSLHSVNTDHNYSVMSAQVVTDLAPGESKTITWQDDGAPAGKYIATARSSGGGSAEVSFEIRG
jgi:hypothetical protein